MPKTDWFAKHGWGVFCHCLTKPETTVDEWNRHVDSFDTSRLAEQLRSVNAPYFVITLGQGSGHYCTPNETYDRIAGLAPSKCAKRDLVADLYDALHPLGIDLLLYAPAEGSWADMEARKGLGMPHHWCDGPWHWEPGKHWLYFRWVPFLRNWEAICREWSLRWGTKIRGWWIDGCYSPEFRYPESEEPNFKSLAAARRAGNPDSILAFNEGVRTPVTHITPHEDFTAGEINYALPECKGPLVKGPGGHEAQFHRRES
ncbi:MAG: hypothetical protein JXR37_23370 [Kiritimatiellae bacterium]|nr:hypothetical protein [Kiritimatiellia bacterium]